MNSFHCMFSVNCIKLLSELGETDYSITKVKRKHQPEIVQRFTIEKKEIRRQHSLHHHLLDCPVPYLDQIYNYLRVSKLLIASLDQTS